MSSVADLKRSQTRPVISQQGEKKHILVPGGIRIGAHLYLQVILTLSFKKFVIQLKLLNWFLKSAGFFAPSSFSHADASRSYRTCNTLWMTSFKPIGSKSRPSSTQTTNESLRSGLAAEKPSQILHAHFISLHKKWTACWWKDDSPICGDHIDEASDVPGPFTCG